MYILMRFFCSGVALTLDIGVIDVTTCQPLPNVMVEVWSRKYTTHLKLLVLTLVVV